MSDMTREAVERLEERLAQGAVSDGSTPARLALFNPEDLRSVLSRYRKMEEALKEIIEESDTTKRFPPHDAFDRGVRAARNASAEIARQALGDSQ